MIYSVCSDVGNVRKSNEDSYAINRFHPGKDVWFFGVADGMGGHHAGDVASSLALKSIIGYLEEKLRNFASFTNDETDRLLYEALQTANKDIYEYSVKHAGHMGMGTTVTVCVYYGGILNIGHIGDSRAYLIDDYRIIQLTKDHSLVGEMVQNGSITESEAMIHPQRNILTRALGTERVAMADFQTRKVDAGDVLLICTDGLTNLVSKEETFLTVAGSDDFARVAHTLVEQAKARGGYDNITVLGVKF